ncbi:hypothetical protein [Hymenobacter yonginensis]|uniref:DUF304 domain-containing protein n=1 Tax=Hymenobacter yonginensis TaxID=748197 RepID=A0ABY7PIQ0_9BACT|nr:hypothetical protein [Hymenobacter yonginensis]WBO83208.1 hypothetical protein O9Z63_12545 [Hymenobacter yonginensis]
MAEPVSLLLRAEPPRWVKAVHYTGIFLLGSFAMAAFGVRVMGERAATTSTRGLLGPLQALLWATSAAAAAWLLVVALLYRLKAARVIRMGPRQASGTIRLSQDLVVLADQTIAVRDLKSIVVTSDQYAGAVRGRGVSSGAGNIVLTYKGTAREAAFPVVIQSAQELQMLRDLSAYWRSQQVTALVMD